MTLRLLLVRHGLSSFNLEHRIQGRNDLSTLTSEGEAQAFKTGEELAQIPIHAVYSSPLQRAADTAKNILKAMNKELEPIFDKGLLEVDLGPWSGLTINEVISKYPDAYKTWKKEPKELVLKRNDGSEFKPINQLIEQTRDFLERLLQKHSLGQNETVLIIGHNAILRCLILELIGHPKNGFRRLQLNNSSLSVFNLKPSKNNSFEVQIECLNSTTHLSPPLPRKGKHSRVILVRHGETDWNLEGRFQGQIDIPLNKNGHSQALAAGLFLKNIPLSKAYSSSMTRPKQTAEAILQSHKSLELQSEEGLVEIGHGLWEGKLESEIRKEWPELLQKWQDSPESVEMPEGETIQEVWTRALITWEKICSNLQDEDTALVVAHDAVNKTILCHLLGLTPAEIWMVKQGNGGITIVDISPNDSQPDVVTCLNLTSHIGGIIDSTAAGAL